MEKIIERYQFQSLHELDRTLIEAVGSYENDSLVPEKGLILCFTPSDSISFNKHVRDVILSHGGVLFSGQNLHFVGTATPSVSNR